MQGDRITLTPSEQRRLLVLNHLGRACWWIRRRPACWGSGSARVAGFSGGTRDSPRARA